VPQKSLVDEPATQLYFKDTSKIPLCKLRGNDGYPPLQRGEGRILVEATAFAPTHFNFAVLRQLRKPCRSRPIERGKTHLKIDFRTQNL
jgi:hypothetical protein